jgi:cellobiose phosphorylase
MTIELVTREFKTLPDQLLRNIFSSVLREDWVVDAIFADSGMDRVIGIANIKRKMPILHEMINNQNVNSYFKSILTSETSVLIVPNDSGTMISIFTSKDEVKEIVEVPASVKETILLLLSKAATWGGYLNQRGEHVIDLRSPLPGPHFGVNLLLGNRIGFPHALQTTPKSVVDRLGRGSFRTHAATQVLATRWDLRQEENGFPANRQFYLVEKGRKIFCSADPTDNNLKTAVCTHSQNKTVICYQTHCGLEIERTIFLLPQEEGFPLAVEAQDIIIRNSGHQPRELKLVYSGMFGPAYPNAMQEDVLYTNIIMQSKLLRNDDGSIKAVSVSYRPEGAGVDLRFHSMLVHHGDCLTFPREYCLNYNEFVGNGTLENPAGLYQLNNQLSRKGPGFFALAAPLFLPAGEASHCLNFTGVVSQKVNPQFNDDTFEEEIDNLIHKFAKPGEVIKTIAANDRFYQQYRNFLQIKTSDESFNQYFNLNLPFQVLYQTFVSRSFCQTQKGYREIGFREIQDIYAAMYYFAGMGKAEFVKELLKEWCSKIFEFGYAYHNFFWVGKEPGKWSDDALWFIQALSRYINLTGDLGFLDEECEVAGTDPVRTRSVYDTVKAVLMYSGEISIGKHGMPLLDYADWNDCLKLDNNYLNGIAKEKLYQGQIGRGGALGRPLDSDHSESVMNAFLLKLAIDETAVLAGEKGDTAYAGKLKQLSGQLYANLQTHAWRENFFARVIFNRDQNNEFTYLGAKGDGLSADPAIDGVYFLNSFNWAILSDSAGDEQIAAMVDTIEKVLKTPFGLKLVSPADLSKVAEGTATGEYFPGDRENGGVFKHACMMATAAMFMAAKRATNHELAEKLTRLAYWMIDLVLPYKTMDDPFVICGNPRFCTQYNNSETGENIGPMLSGTSTWLILSLLAAFGIEYTSRGIEINPILRPDETLLEYTLNTGKTIYQVSIQKPLGFYRLTDSNVSLEIDGIKVEGQHGSYILPLLKDGREHKVILILS